MTGVERDRMIKKQEMATEGSWRRRSYLILEALGSSIRCPCGRRSQAFRIADRLRSKNVPAMFGEPLLPLFPGLPYVQLTTAMVAVSTELSQDSVQFGQILQVGQWHRVCL